MALSILPFFGLPKCVPQFLPHLRPTRWATGLCSLISNCLAGINDTWTHELYTDMAWKLLYGFYILGHSRVQTYQLWAPLSYWDMLSLYLFGVSLTCYNWGLFLPVAGNTGTGTIVLLGPAASITTSPAGTLGGTLRRKCCGLGCFPPRPFEPPGCWSGSTPAPKWNTTHSRKHRWMKTCRKLKLTIFVEENNNNGRRVSCSSVAKFVCFPLIGC